MDLFCLCLLLLPGCACPGEPRCDSSPNWDISATFNCVSEIMTLSEGTVTCASAQASDELWPVGNTECRAEWPYWRFYCYIYADIVAFSSWAFTLKVIIQLYFNFPVQIGPKI